MKLSCLPTPVLMLCSRFAIVLSCASMLWAAAVGAQSLPHYVIPRVSSAPAIDGLVDGSEWSQAVRIDSTSR